VEGSYYSRRSARDPAWRDAQIEGAKERERLRREADPDALRVARRLATRRCRAKQSAEGLTFAQLARRSPVPDRAVLALVLRDEVASGRIEYHSTSRRYRLNGGLDPGTRRAFLDLHLGPG
jgi:hypothetical protein